MSDREGIVKLQGNPVTLTGNEVKTGDSAPDFTATANDMSPSGLADYKGKVLVILAVPSLDTPVCDTEVRRFNQEAAALGDNVNVLTISVDLPFAQKRWCGAAGVDNVVTLSDHKDTSFGLAYGVLIKELRLLARAAFVVDKEGVIRYADIMGEVAEEPNYDEIIAEVKKHA